MAFLMEFSSSSQGIIERRGETKSTESFEARHITFSRITLFYDTRLTFLLIWISGWSYSDKIWGEKKGKKTNSHAALQSFRLGVKAGVVMIPLLGVSWLFGFLSPLHKVFTYIFTILNSTQVSLNSRFVILK